MEGRHGEHIALDDGPVTVGAKSRLGVGHFAHIADVDVAKTSGAGDVASPD
jgi:hypothetical protein